MQWSRGMKSNLSVPHSTVLALHKRWLRTDDVKLEVMLQMVHVCQGVAKNMRVDEMRLDFP